MLGAPDVKFIVKVSRGSRQHVQWPPIQTSRQLGAAVLVIFELHLVAREGLASQLVIPD